MGRWELRWLKGRRRCWRGAVWMLVLLGTLAMPRGGEGYSVQTHEQLIDLAWKGSIVPLLRSRHPKVTEAELENAHAYAFGGSALQDIGYYPFGNQFFTNLTHYVRSGDFVESLLRNARTPQELAFAVGSLSHYLGDSIGHAEAVNPSVGLEFPSLAERYGPVVVYDESPHAHVRTEFAFDVDEISKHRFAPSRYLKHVGLKVATDLLARSAEEIYGLRLEEMLGRERHAAIRGYRFSVRSFLPRIAYAEAVLHRHSFPVDLPGVEVDRLTRDLAESQAENGWERYGRRRAGIGTYTLAGLILVLPKVGVLSELAIRIPDTATEGLYAASVNRTADALRAATEALREGAPGYPNRDLDTGATVKPGGYRLTDETYAKLLGRITRDPGVKVAAGLKRDITSYYGDPNAPIRTKRKPRQWEQVQAELVTLRGMGTIPEP